MHVDAAGVNHGKTVVLPFHVTVDPVAGHAGRIFHNADALSGNFVKEC